MVSSNGSLKTIDFRSRESAKSTAATPEEDDDLMAAADRAMQQAEVKHPSLSTFEKASQEYSEKIESGDNFEFGTPMPLSAQSSYNEVVKETFNPATLLNLFKDNVTEMTEGLTLLFTKRASPKDHSALVVITPLGEALHMMSYCVKLDDDA